MCHPTNNCTERRTEYRIYPITISLIITPNNDVSKQIEYNFKSTGNVKKTGLFST